MNAQYGGQQVTNYYTPGELAKTLESSPIGNALELPISPLVEGFSALKYGTPVTSPFLLPPDALGEQKPLPDVELPNQALAGSATSLSTPVSLISRLNLSSSLLNLHYIETPIAGLTTQLAQEFGK